jgi:error-prone DNA polymerase
VTDLPEAQKVKAPDGRSDPVKGASNLAALRRHPFAFLRQDLAPRKMATCADVRAARDGAWLTVAGVVLVRQMPASVVRRSLRGAISPVIN